MNVAQAVTERRSVRAFLDRPVPADMLRDLVVQAARAPSGGNLQPWHVDVVTGGSMAAFRAIMRRRLVEAPMGETLPYDIYPKGLTAPYRDRRFAVGEAMYAELDVAREDKPARLQWFARNYDFFGAPAALFVTVDRQMGPPQWSDLGMYLQSVMLLAQAAGLATCAQECWAVYADTVTTFLDTPPERMLFCGMAIGHEDTTAPVNRLRTSRAPNEEWLTLRS